jgi:glycyl-tRNA synthetase
MRLTAAVGRHPIERLSSPLMAELFDTIVNLCKRRGLIFPSSEIYGGVRSTWDYGPLGVELKRNVKDAWWKHMVRLRDDVVGLDAAILMHPRTWEASGHVETFSDPLVECGGCHQRFRADHLPDSGACPNCGKKEFGDPRNFNLMFKTYVGPVEDATSVAWLRPETAQGIFVNFKTVQTTSRKKLPFGIAQVGKSFRNEITPGNFTYRTREFEQMEMEFFCEPGTDEEWHQYWIDARHKWYLDYGIREDKLRLREHEQDELSHYSKRTVDIEYAFPWTEWGELEGIANRSDFDLNQHMKFSGEDLQYYDQANDRRFTPYVIEPAAGADRATLAFLIDAYHEEEARTHDGKSETRVMLKLHPALAPTKVAVLPLSKKPDLAEVTQRVASELRSRWAVDTDDAGSIGRRYRRQDEVGTPFCVTVDFDTLEDQAVTIRDRDTMQQERIALDKVTDYIADRFGPEV